MWFIARSVYTTEYSNSPPPCSSGRGDEWYGLAVSWGSVCPNGEAEEEVEEEENGQEAIARRVV
jgi:hypothetical protein